MLKKGCLPAGYCILLCHDWFKCNSSIFFSREVLSTLNEASNHSSGTAISSCTLSHANWRFSNATATVGESFFSCLKLDHFASPFFIQPMVRIQNNTCLGGQTVLLPICKLAHWFSNSTTTARDLLAFVP